MSPPLLTSLSSDRIRDSTTEYTAITAEGDEEKRALVDGLVLWLWGGERA